MWLVLFLFGIRDDAHVHWGRREGCQSLLRFVFVQVNIKHQWAVHTNLCLPFAPFPLGGYLSNGMTKGKLIYPDNYTSPRV